MTVQRESPDSLVAAGLVVPTRCIVDAFAGTRLIIVTGSAAILATRPKHLCRTPLVPSTRGHPTFR
jgi:hypothetical protein